MGAVDIVAWSGGMDSTLVLNKLCESRKIVWAFSIIWDLIDKLKTCKEKIARNNYLKYAKKKEYRIEHREIVITANMGALQMGLPQLLGWCSFLVPYLPEESTLHFGYHKGDDFWEFALAAEYFMNWATYIGQRKVKLGYPLKDMSKYEIIREFRKRRIPLYCTWTCEAPIIRNGKAAKCGNCDPCTALKLAKYEGQLRG